MRTSQSRVSGSPPRHARLVLQPESESRVLLLRAFLSSLRRARKHIYDDAHEMRVCMVFATPPWPSPQQNFTAVSFSVSLCILSTRPHTHAEKTKTPRRTDISIASARTQRDSYTHSVMVSCVYASRFTLRSYTHTHTHSHTQSDNIHALTDGRARSSLRVLHC